MYFVSRAIFFNPAKFSFSFFVTILLLQEMSFQFLSVCLQLWMNCIRLFVLVMILQAFTSLHAETCSTKLHFQNAFSASDLKHSQHFAPKIARALLLIIPTSFLNVLLLICQLNKLLCNTDHSS